AASRCHAAKRISRHETSIAALTWSADEKPIAYLATEPLSPEQKARERIGDDEMVFSISDSDRHAPPQKLWVLDTATRKTRLIATGPYHISGAIWHPDGARLLITIADQSNMDNEWIRSRLAVVDAGGGEPRLFCSIPGRFARPRWLPDGKAVSFLAASAEGREPAASSLYLCSGEGSHAVNLTE